MSALSIQPTYPIFTETDGQPLEDGYIWIGTANLDPEGNPINVYWDAALTQLAGQPIRTQGGYPVNSGTPARLYVNSDYSIRVMNKNGSVVYSAPASTERYNNAVVNITIESEDVLHTSPWLGSVQTTAYAKFNESVSVLDFMTDEERTDVIDNIGSVDVSAKVRLALDHAGLLPAGCQVIFPAGTYYIPTTVFIPTQVGLSIVGFGATVKGAGEGVGTIFETGAQDYSTGGTTNWGFDEQYLHRKQIIDGFTFINCEYGIRAFNMLEGCVIQHNRANATVRTFLHAKRCFYLAILQNMHRGALTTGDNDEDACFYIESFNNVMNIQGNSAYRGNNGALARGTGFRFTGGCSGMEVLNNVAEGCNKGILLDGAVYGLLISGWYLEGNVRDISIEDANPKTGLAIDGCWFESDQSVLASSWISGELGQNNYYYTSGSTVDLTDSANSCDVWLPNRVGNFAGSYSLATLPTGWTVNGSCRLRRRWSTYNDAIGPQSEIALLSEYVLGDSETVARAFRGNSGLGVAQNAGGVPYCTTDVNSSAGEAIIDTKIVYSSLDNGVRFDFTVQDNVSTYRLLGWISGLVVTRDDVTTKTVVVSDNGGYLRVVLGNFSTASAVTVTGGIRIV